MEILAVSEIRVDTAKIQRKTPAKKRVGWRGCIRSLEWNASR